MEDMEDSVFDEEVEVAKEVSILRRISSPSGVSCSRHAFFCADGDKIKRFQDRPD